MKTANRSIFSILVGILFLMMHVSPTYANPFACFDISPDLLFDTHALNTDQQFSSAMKSYACNDNQLTGQDMDSIGVPITLAESVLGYNFNEASFLSWKQQNCNGTSHSENRAAALNELYRFADQKVLSTWLACKKMETQIDSTGLHCSLDTPDKYHSRKVILDITWRASSDTDSRPTIKAIQMEGITCSNDVTNESISTGGLNSICTRDDKFKPSIVIVNASNGQSDRCYIPGALTEDQKENKLMARWYAQRDSLSQSDLASVRCIQQRQTVRTDLQSAKSSLAIVNTCSQYFKHGHYDSTRICLSSMNRHAYNAPAKLSVLRNVLAQQLSEAKARVAGIADAYAKYKAKACVE